MNKQERLTAVNKLIKVIAGCGRKFLQHDGFIASMELSEHGRVFFVDHYSKKRIYTHRRYVQWNGFTSGGTMKDLVEAFKDFIIRGSQLRAAYFQPDMGNGFSNPWGYGEDILEVKKAAENLGIAV